MITNESQYRATKTQAEKFAAAIAGLEAKPLGDTDPILRRAEIEAMKSTLEELLAELAGYAHRN